MKTINLFVACPEDSDDLNALKEEIKKLCHKLNDEYAEKKMQEEVNIIAVTYMNPERRKEICKEIIKYRADIVLFLFDDAPDENLMDELRITVERSNTFHKPEPLVFIKTGKKKKDDDSRDDLREDINEILAKGGWLYELFTDKHDLWQKTRYKIEQYFHSHDIIRKIQRWSKIWYYFLMGLCVVIPAIIIWLSFSLHKAESKRLLIVGGGSARAFFEDSIFHEKGSLSTKFWLYAPLPSGDAYRMMAEEIINISNSDYKSHPYFPIVISAGKAKMIPFLEEP